jgi:hypothetical protein
MDDEEQEVFWCNNTQALPPIWSHPIRKAMTCDSVILLDGRRVYCGIWHRTTEKLPTYDKLVLVTDGKYMETGKFQPKYNTHRSSHDWECRDLKGHLLPGVIAWFPLPELNISGDADEKDMRP